MTRQRRTFSTEFKRDAASLVLDQGYRIAEAVKSLGVGESVLRRWVEQERGGVTPKVKALTPEQQRIYEHKHCSRLINVERLEQCSKIKALFKASRHTAGSRTLLGMMRALGYQMGRFKVRSLMKEAGIVSKQPGPHRDKTARIERLDIPNHLQ